jgi:hypothetical protein
MNAERQQALWNSIYIGLVGYLAVAVFFIAQSFPEAPA